MGEKIERMESKAAALRKSLLSAWVVTQEQRDEVTEKMGEVSVSEPAGFSSSTVNTGRPSTLAIGCGRPRLAAWTSGQCPIKEEDKEPRGAFSQAGPQAFPLPRLLWSLLRIRMMQLLK